MRVLYFGTYDRTYARNRILIDGLRLNGVQVQECHVPLWHDTSDKVLASSGGWVRPAFVVKAAWCYVRLVWKYWRHVRPYDVMVLGYTGQFDVPVARILTWLTRRKLVLDLLMSLHLIVTERALDKRSHLSHRLVRAVEGLACRLPDRLVLDTPEYVDYFCQQYGLNRDRFRLVPLGADDRLFQPVRGESGGDPRFRVLFYGSFLPLHGVEYIVRSAALVADRNDIVFELIGRGPEKEPAEQLAAELGLTNVQFFDRLEPHELAQRVAMADVCLGVFGLTKQSLCTVQNKIYETLMMGKPLITGDAPTLRERFTHGEHLYAVPRADPKGLAEAILVLKEDPGLREHLANEGHRLVSAEHTVAALGKRLRAVLEEVVGGQATRSRPEQAEGSAGTPAELVSREAAEHEMNADGGRLRTQRKA
jgi:glycosyltransferase involved in cell wall biosynthesis